MALFVQTFRSPSSRTSQSRKVRLKIAFSASLPCADVSGMCELHPAHSTSIQLTRERLDDVLFAPVAFAASRTATLKLTNDNSLLSSRAAAADGANFSSRLSIERLSIIVS